jgi:hypothetical protein
MSDDPKAVPNQPVATQASNTLLDIDEDENETPQGAAEVPGTVIAEEPVPQGVADPNSEGNNSLEMDISGVPLGGVGVPKTGGIPAAAFPMFNLAALGALAGSLTLGAWIRRRKK